MSRQARRAVVVRASEDEKSEEVEYNKEFGYSRKDVILIGVGLIGGGFLFKWGLELAGVDPIMAGTVGVFSGSTSISSISSISSIASVIPYCCAAQISSLSLTHVFLPRR